MAMIEYRTSLGELSSDQLTGFFVGWPNPPSPQTMVALLQKAYRICLAFDTDSNKVIGFTYAISDGILSAYIPLLEVLPDHQGKGIGTELIQRLTDSLSGIYMIDAVCDDDVVPFYSSLGFFKAAWMMLRNYERQSGI